jgi:hypothetical protein
VDAGEFSDTDFFRQLANSRARVLLIGRRALIALGAPVMTVDYDLWAHIDDIELLNTALGVLDQYPDRTPQRARETGRYVLENGERVDVMVARAATEPGGIVLTFDAAWQRRVTLEIHGSAVHLPSIDDLIVTKRWGSRPKDMIDIQWLKEIDRKP